ncbi:MAG: radical SAM protein [Desulfobacteraceae bacterium]|nr:radical SAM protein [Desulfobacteraceae bacterium]
MKYLFGPVNSRRLGLSLGIDLLPGNVCNFDCVYCEVGATGLLTCERAEYSPTGEILAEIDLLLADPAAPAPDVFTVTATGEPTLHTGLGTIIRHLKAKTTTPVAVLTNGSLLFRPEVRADLAAADIVVPSLDAAIPRSHRRVNRPAPCADLETIIGGLASFRREFRGEIWLEILLVKDLNDSEEDIAALREAAARIRPDRIQLNTVARPPLESYARPIDLRDMEAIAARFPGRVETLVDASRREGARQRPAAAAEILELLRRRPCTLDDICTALSLEAPATKDLLAKLAGDHLLTTVVHNQREYMMVSPEGSDPARRE